MSATAAPKMGFGNLDLGLTASQEEHARRIHAQALIIELMFQGPCSYHSLDENSLPELRARWRESGSGDVFLMSLHAVSKLAAAGQLDDYAAVWRQSGLTGSNIQVGDIVTGGHTPRLAEMNAYSWYGQALAADDFRIAKQTGRCVSFLNMQSLPGTIDRVGWFDEAYEAGLRMAGLTYNHQNQFGAGCTSDDAGLTPFGRESVARMNLLGMLVDVAHAGIQTTLDACRYSSSPVIASHAGAKGVYDHARNKSDDELRALADTGGLIGMVAVPMFLGPKLPGDISLMFDHIDYVADLVGIDHVAVGTDWPMELPKWVIEPGGPFERWTRDMGFREGDLERLDVNLVGFDDYRDYPNITRGLVKRGYADEDIFKILGGNALRVISAVWK